MDRTRCPHPRRMALLLCAALAGLAGCGTAANDPLSSIGLGLIERISGSAEEDPNPIAAAVENPAVMRQLVDQLDISLLLLEVPSTGGAALYTDIARNGNAVTWQGGEALAVILTERGVLRGTRGFGDDLMSADPRSTEAALTERRSGTVDRLPILLTGDLRETREIHRCTMEIDGPEQVPIIDRMVTLTRATESCNYSGGSYQNLYWIDASGSIIRSQQWASPGLGHVHLTRLQ